MKLLTMLFGMALEFLYQYTRDYGIAIVCLTVLAKLCLLPLQVIQRKNMENPQANLSGCLLLLVQLSVMVCLYRSIAVGMTARIGTKLLPWVETLLTRDPYGILPALSAIVQMIPQMIPYAAFFQSLHLPKPAPGMLASQTVMTILICLPLPSGVGLYYLVSGLFSAVEQTAWNVWRVRRLKRQGVVG